MKCLNCKQKEATKYSKYSNGKFCSRECAHSYSSKKDKQKTKTLKCFSCDKNVVVGKRSGTKVLCTSCKKSVCKKCGKIIQNKGVYQLCVICLRTNKKYIHNLSVSLKGKTGGIRHGGGNGKSGWYKGYWCDSSWELAFVIYNIEHNISFKRNTEKFEYTWNNKTKRYVPDFILPSGEYVEIKGYWSKQFDEKRRVFPHTLNILDKKKIRVYIEYVQNKYGSNYINMYE